MNRAICFLIFLVAAVLVAGCAGTALSTASKDANDAAFQFANGPTSPQGTASSGEIRLAAGDKIRVTVFGEDKISGEYQIDTGGFVSLPLAGTIQAAGLTKRDLEQVLAKQLRSEYLRNPKVTVDVANFRPFYVLGEVQKPGEYQFRSGLNVLSAIAIAGGASYRASTSNVLIQRSGATELKEYPLSPNVMVMPGDLIRVPERFF